MTKEEKNAKAKAKREAKKALTLTAPSVPVIAETPTLVVPDPPANEQSILFEAEITHDGVKDKDGKEVADRSNIYGHVRYENKGVNLNYALIAGRLAQDLHSVYLLLGKGISRKHPFNVKLHIKTSEGNEVMATNVVTRLNDPITTAFAVANLIARKFTPEAAEALLTGNFSIDAGGQLFNRKLGLPLSADHLPYHLIEKMRDEKRKTIKKETTETRSETLAAINKMGTEEYRAWQKKLHAEAKVKAEVNAKLKAEKEEKIKAELEAKAALEIV
jgi:hypothetical protein